jgi:hypothetical protein
MNRAPHGETVHGRESCSERIMKSDSYHQLEVWQKVVALVTEIYQITGSCFLTLVS